MSVTVRIPAPLRKITGGKTEISGTGASLRELVKNLDGSYPGFLQNICDASGKIHPFINLYINDEDVRYIKELDSPISDGDKVAIVPAIAGGFE